MKKVMLNFFVIALQLLIVIVFGFSVFHESIEIKRHVNIVHNDNLDKIADSVSLLFLPSTYIYA